ncbi:hypothetical protein THIOKS12210041 [Thiocapsa sp. KS1]|nr:hypothetical protein THIOKS12210041 [Thiocapsa sp. KS1]
MPSRCLSTPAAVSSCVERSYTISGMETLPECGSHLPTLRPPLQPDLQPLRIKLRIQAQQLGDGVVRQRDTVGAGAGDQIGTHGALDAGLAVGVHVVRLGQCDVGEGADAGAQVVDQIGGVLDSAVVGEIHGLWCVGHELVEAGEPGIGIEGDRGGRGEQPGAGGGVEFAVGDAEGVAGEEAAAGLVVDAAVVIGVTGRVDEPQRAAGEVEGVAVLGDDDALFRHRRECAEVSCEGVLAVDGGGAGGQAARVDHVGRAFRVDHQARVRAGGHQGTCSAAVVEVDVGRDDVVHMLRSQTQVVDHAEQTRNRVGGARVDEGKPIRRAHQIAGSEAVPVETGLKAIDTGVDLLVGAGAVDMRVGAPIRIACLGWGPSLNQAPS